MEEYDESLFNFPENCNCHVSCLAYDLGVVAWQMGTSLAARRSSQLAARKGLFQHCKQHFWGRNVPHPVHGAIDLRHTSLEGTDKNRERRFNHVIPAAKDGQGAGIGRLGLPGCHRGTVGSRLYVQNGMVVREYSSGAMHLHLIFKPGWVGRIEGGINYNFLIEYILPEIRHC